MFRAGSRSVIQVVLRPQNGANKLKIASLFNRNNKAISRALSTLISKKKSLIAQTNTLNEYTYLRESRQPWFGQYRSYADAKKDQNDNKDKAKDEEDEEMETKGKEEDEAKPDAEEAAQAGQYGGAGASVFMGSLYYLVTRQDMESTKKDSNVVLMLDLAHRRRIEEHSSIMRLNGAETLRDLVTPTIDTADHYFAYNPKVITFERAAELMKDNSNIPTLLESGAIRRVTDPEEIAKIEQMTPGEELEFKVNDRMVTKSYPNFQAAAMAWLRKPENQSLRRMMYPRKPKWRRGWYSGALWDLFKARMIYAPLLGMIAGIIASILLLLWLLLSKKSHYYFGRLTTNIRESLFAGLSLVLPFDLPTPERDYKALKETIYQELVDEGYVVLPEEIDPEPNPDEPQPEQNNSA